MKWNKIGHIFNPQEVNDGVDRTWMNGYSQCTSAIIFDNFVRVWFSCRPEVDSNGQYVSYTTFIDLDRNDLTKVINVAKEPVLSLGELGTFDEFAIYPMSVIKFDKQLALYYAGWSRCQSTPYNVSIGLAFSNDNGQTFNRYGKGPILTNSLFEPFELSGPKVRKIGKKWYMYYLAGEKWTMIDGKAESTYKIRLAISDNGLDWTKLNKSIISDVLPEECQAGPDVIYANGKYNMFFSYRHAHDFKNKERGYKIGYAYSHNAVDWTRDDSQVGIGLSDEGWDSQMHHYPHVFELDGKYYMLYNGNDFGKYGFGLAMLEGDM